MTTLLQTDCSNLTFSNTNPYFDKIADNLLNNHLLKVNDTSYRLLEIELYLYSQNHPDVYVHQDKEQLDNNTWYFHGSGLDITFGGANCHGGILIRAIQEITDKEEENKPIFGPINVVRALFSKFQSPFEGQPNDFGFVPMENNTSKTDVYKCYRIGLNPKKEGGTAFINQYYRYLIFPHLKHKEKTKIGLALKEQGVRAAFFIGTTVKTMDKILIRP